MSEIAGIYYDGRTNRAHAVRVRCDGACLHLEGDALTRSDPLAEVDPSPRLAGVPYTLRFRDGARLQLPPEAPVPAWFPRRHRLQAWVDRLERRARVAAAAVVVVAAALLALFGWGVPAAADYVAAHLPPMVDRALGRQSLALLVGRLLRPSALEPQRRDELRARFRAFVACLGDGGEVRLDFYDSPQLGANAFSLGGGIIVFTDAMVRVLPDDEAFLAVAAHELGHERGHHMLRLILRSSGVVLAGTLLLGDVSAAGSVVAAVPTFLLNTHYTRGFEEQADGFALDMLVREGISPAAFVEAMRALEAAHPELRDDAGARYLSTHPVTRDRIARAEAAAARFDARPRVPVGGACKRP